MIVFASFFYLYLHLFIWIWIIVFVSVVFVSVGLLTEQCSAQWDMMAPNVGGISIIDWIKAAPVFFVFSIFISSSSGSCFYSFAFQLAFSWRFIGFHPQPPRDFVARTVDEWLDCDCKGGVRFWSGRWYEITLLLDIFVLQCSNSLHSPSPTLSLTSPFLSPGFYPQGLNPINLLFCSWP